MRQTEPYIAKSGRQGQSAGGIGTMYPPLSVGGPVDGTCVLLRGQDTVLLIFTGLQCRGTAACNQNFCTKQKTSISLDV